VRVFIAHNVYQQRGGEDAVVDGECELLTKNGHDTYIFLCNNDELQTIRNRVEAGLNTVWSRKSVYKIGIDLNCFRPKLVHVHNFFPLITPSVYDACIEAGVPVVQTLHNYRILCPGALLMRDGHVCERCIHSSPYHAVLYKCYRDSRLGSFAVARMVDYHRRRSTWNHKVDRFIALTEFAKSKFVEAGIEPEKIAVKPNFVTDPFPDALPGGKRKGALFVGRLSVEKGIVTLAWAWRRLDYPLTVAGDGPESGWLDGVSSISRLGQVGSRRIGTLMATSAFLVMPSEWYEGFPMVLVESFAHGLPVIVSRLGSMAEIVEDGVTGLHFEPGDAEDLAEKAQWMIDHPRQCREMGENARQVYLEKYTPEKNYQMLMRIYKEAIDARKSTRA